jgi:polyhydroxyalkanoate synthase
MPARPDAAPGSSTPTPALNPQQLARLSARALKVSAELALRQGADAAQQGPDPLHLARPLAALTASLAAEPERLWQAGWELWQGQAAAWGGAALRAWGLPAPDPVRPAKDDRRFQDPAWTSQIGADLLMQSYLLTSRTVQGLVDGAEGLPAHDRKRLSFWTRQVLSSLSPSNFPMTHPGVVQATVDQGGMNLVRGLENLLDDVEGGRDKLRLRMSDQGAFTVGVDVAATPGAVVFESPLLQLIQTDPSTAEVAATPVLIVPPWINKYYILDLRPDNSFLRWVTAMGRSTFIVSWVNPGEEHRATTWDDYCRALQEAIHAVRVATGAPQVHLVSYCIGGTLSASALAVLAHKGEDVVASATFLTTLTAFTDVGEIDVFISDEQVADLERGMEAKGFLTAAEMSTSFRMLRENDLIWGYVVDQYLYGKAPMPFDLLFWNEDSTRMPAAMHSWYLRNLYMKDLLVKPDALVIDGQPVDLRRVKVPVYQLSCDQDHIAPWQTTYALTQVHGGPTTFVLGGSGHIAGVVNPPTKKRYGHRVLPAGEANPAEPEAFFARSEARDGSWWPHWMGWLDAQEAAPRVPARRPGDGALPVIEPAPGRYVKVRRG